MANGQFALQSDWLGAGSPESLDLSKDSWGNELFESEYFPVSEEIVQAGIKVWLAGAWSQKPVKVWSGSAWVTKTVKRWNGSAWV